MSNTQTWFFKTFLFLSTAACTGLERNPLAQTEATPGAGAPDASAPGSGSTSAGGAAGAGISNLDHAGGLCGIFGRGGVRAVAPLPDGLFAVGYSNGRIVFYATGSNAAVPRALDAHASAIARLRVSPDGRLLASVAESGEVVLWNLVEGKRQRAVAAPGSNLHALAFSPDGAALALAFIDHIELQSTADGAPRWEMASRQVGTLFFTADGQTVVHGGDTLAVRSTSDGTLVRELSPSYGVLAVSSDGGTLLGFRSRTSTVAAVRVSDGRELWSAPLPSPMQLVAGAFSLKGDRAAVATKEGSLLEIDPQDGHLVRTLALDGAGAALAYSTDGARLAVGLAGGAMQVWNVASGALEIKEPAVPGHTGPLNKIAFSSDGALIASISGDIRGDHTFKVWRTSDSALLYSVGDTDKVLDGARKSFAFSPDGSTLALSDDTVTDRIHILRTSDGARLRTLEMADATDLAFSPDGSLLVSTPYFLAPGIPAVRARRAVDGGDAPGFGDVEQHGGGQVVFSPDGRLLAATGAGNWLPARPAVTVWKVADRSLVWSVPGQAMPLVRGEPSAAAFSPDGGLLAVAQPTSATVALYRAENGTPVRTLAANGVVAVAFSPTGALLAAAGDEGLHLWRPSAGSTFGVIPGHFTTVAFSPDGHAVLVGGQDGVMQLFCSISQRLP